jgi:hypothetical protein
LFYADITTRNSEHRHIIGQHKKLLQKNESHGSHQKIGVNSDVREG